MRLTLVVPGLLSLPSDTLSRDPALARLAAIASPVEEADVDSAVIADIGLEASPAPLAAVGAGLDIGTRWTIRADPVTLVVGREDARLEHVVHDLGDAERATLLALMNAHFRADGLAFAAPRADAWFATMDMPQSIRTVAAERALGVPLRPLLPQGRDAAVWRRWFTETQMLLHDHPLTGRLRPPNAVWFSGGGVLPALAGVPALHARASEGRTGDVVRGLARMRGEQAAPPAKMSGQGNLEGRDVAIVALAAVATSAALEALARDFLVPSLDALERSRLSSLKLIADGPRGAASWNAQPTSWLARWTRRSAVFTLPPFHAM